MARVALLALLLVWSGLVGAVGVVSQSTQYTFSSFSRSPLPPGAVGLTGGSVSVVASGLASLLNAQEPVQDSFCGPGLSGKYIWSAGTATGPLTAILNVSACGSSSVGGYLFVTSAMQCPVGSTNTAGQCVCDAGMKPGTDGASCVGMTCPAAGSPPADTSSGYSWTGRGGNVCVGGCQYSAGVYGYQSASNTTTASGQHMVSAGVACNGVGGSGNSAGSTGPEAPCPSGQCPGTVNGARICVPCAQTGTGPSSSASAPAGQPTPTIPNAPPGSTSSDSQTTCSGGNCTTIINYYGPNGQKTGESSETKPETSFCKENPGSPLCKSSAISGSCSAVTCDGDAIQCAMAKEQARRNCDLFDTATPLSILGNASANGDLLPEGHPGRPGAVGTVAMNFSTAIDQSNRLGGGCPQDESFTVAGQSLVIPFSRYCGPFTMIGQVVVGIAMLAAAGIVFRG